MAAKYKQLSRREAEGFYAVHRERPFFNALVEFMISGPVMIQALEGENAVAAHRDLLGATNPRTLRRAPSAPTSPIRSMPMLPTARIRSRTLPTKSRISLPPPKWSRAEAE